MYATDIFRPLTHQPPIGRTRVAPPWSMSELLSLRRENIQLRKKVSHVKALETQNALLHLSVARAEQENITLKDAVVILQRKLLEHENKTLKQASLISECTRGAMGSMNNNINSSRRSDSTSRRGRTSVESTSSAGLSLSPQLAYDTAASSRRNVSPPQQLRRSSASLSPPDYAALYNSKLNERRRSSSPTPPLPTAIMSSLLHTPPKRMFMSGSLRYTPPRATSGDACRSAVSSSPPQRGSLAMDDVEVSAVSSLFSPMSALGGAGCSTPISPRRRAPPSPVPHTAPPWQLSRTHAPAAVSNYNAPIGHRSASPVALPVAASRAANASTRSPHGLDTSPRGRSTSPPLAPRVLAGKPPQGPSRAVSPSGASRGSLRSPVLSRTSSMGSISLSIDEELNEGIQRRLASLTFC